MRIGKPLSLEVLKGRNNKSRCKIRIMAGGIFLIGARITESKKDIWRGECGLNMFSVQ